MELLIIKSGEAYIRVKEDGYRLVGLDKASVYPMDRIETVKALKMDLKNRNFEQVQIKKLVLTEEDFDDDL